MCLLSGKIKFEVNFYLVSLDAPQLNSKVRKMRNVVHGNIKRNVYFKKVIYTEQKCGK